MEENHIGLNSSGSYVLRSFDSAEFERVQKTDYSKLQFSDEDHVVIARGTQGTLAKFAKITSDRKFARYFGGKFISAALIEGEVFSKAEFIRSIAQNPTLLITHGFSAKECIGILHGDIAATYKSLVHPVPNGFLLLDLEENPPPQASHMKVRIVATDPPEGAAVKAELLKRFA
jgi:hypothetical protein